MLHGIQIGEYRSIGGTQEISPLGKINLFVGSNNAGKSNILRFVHENLHILHKIVSVSDGNNSQLTSHPHSKRGHGTKGAIGVQGSKEKVHELLGGDSKTIQLTSTIHNQLIGNGLLWLTADWPQPSLISSAQHWGGAWLWETLWRSKSNATGGSIDRHWVPETLKRLKALVPTPPTIFAIPVSRTVGHGGSVAQQGAATILTGANIIGILASLQNPEAPQFDESRTKFDRVEAFVRTVTDDESATISVPHNQREILVQFRGQRYFPLAQLGSGIEQVVLHAVAATSVTNAIVTFEEPELHLHPVLQRQLMKYLSQKTENQYFIATHSAHLIDTLHTHTFHTRLVSGETVVEAASTDASRHKLCEDLGYRPSDIVQANCVIWVEGPSDRIYLKHWLKEAAPELLEHVHFGIMFYGGKLLSHMSMAETNDNDAALTDLIKLRSLNRQTAVIIDSDLASSSDVIRSTKQRVCDEIATHGGFVWVTKGREIENYIPKQIAVSAVELVAPGLGSKVKGGQFAKVLPLNSSKKSLNKVAVAHAVAKSSVDLSMLDLSDRMAMLCKFVRTANGIPNK